MTNKPIGEKLKYFFKIFIDNSKRGQGKRIKGKYNK